MATISRFIKFTVPNLARHKFLIHYLPFHCRVFEPFDRKLCSKASEDYDNDVLANADHELFGRKPKSAQLNSDYNFSSEIPSKKSDEILPFIRFKEHEHYRNFSSYIFAKKLGEVESAEDFVPHKKIYSTIKDINVLLNVPVACKHFNNGQFPNEKSMLNWIRAIDFGLEQRCITPFGLSIALFSFARLLKDHPDNDKLLSVVGCDRLTTWFQFALKDHNSPSVRNTSIWKCISAASCFARLDAFMEWKLDSLYGLLNNSLSIYVPAQLNYLESFKDGQAFYKILHSIITVEIDLDQPCLLEQATKDDVVNRAVQHFRSYAQWMEESQNMSIRDKQSISVVHDSIARLFCHWSVNDSRFWYDWFEYALNRLFRINEDPRVVSKQLQSLLLALLKSNANHNFICNEADFAKYLGEKVKPVLIENLRANGLQFVTKSRLTILIRLVMDSLHASESPIFTNEELKEIIGVLDPKGI